MARAHAWEGIGSGGACQGCLLLLLLLLRFALGLDGLQGM